MNGNPIDKKNKSIATNYIISIITLLIGFSMYFSIKNNGYYYDPRGAVAIYGEDGFVTAYALIIIGVIILCVSVYQTITFCVKKSKH